MTAPPLLRATSGQVVPTHVARQTIATCLTVGLFMCLTGSSQDGCGSDDHDTFESKPCALENCYRQWSTTSDGCTTSMGGCLEQDYCAPLESRKFGCCSTENCNDATFQESFEYTGSNTGSNTGSTANSADQAPVAAGVVVAFAAVGLAQTV